MGTDYERRTGSHCSHEGVAHMTLLLPDKVIAHINGNWFSPVKDRNTLIGGEERGPTPRNDAVRILTAATYSLSKRKELPCL